MGGEIAQWLWELTAFTEGLDSVPRTHMEADNCL